MGSGYGVGVVREILLDWVFMAVGEKSMKEGKIFGFSPFRSSEDSWEFGWRGG